MGDQQRIQRITVEDTLQRLQAAFVVHLGSLAREEEQGACSISSQPKTKPPVPDRFFRKPTAVFTANFFARSG
jgi:hypothetical protein